jgi:hypothetical protein
MNRIVNRIPTQRRQPVSNPYYRPTQKLHADAETALRDIACVLALTRRVKASILEGHDEDQIVSDPRRLG